MEKYKYIITVPNLQLCDFTDPRVLLTQHATSLKEARRIWRGSKGKRIYKLIA